MAIASAWSLPSSLALAAWVVMLALATFPLQVLAQDDDLPGRVGRVADIAGQLFLAPEDRPDEWAAIGINYPITTGGNLRVSGDGRVEVDYGGGQIRLGSDTSVHVSRLDDRQLALFIAQGRLLVRVRSLDPGDVTRVDTPNTHVTLMRAGLYRIDVTPDRQTTTLTVREGEAEVALASDAQQALPGQTVVVTGADASIANVRYASSRDDFDAWSSNRDRRYDRALSANYVSRQMVGYADLDDYGSWQTLPDYGSVWFPTAVAPEWAPYQDGYWTDVGSWGPTWVDLAPWGYAPFHYGRWAHIGGRWGWCPGAYTRRPAWAPALVAWYGGKGWGREAGHGAPVYGWVPLGWREAYHPTGRHCSQNCWERYNRPYAVNVATRQGTPPARYANLAVPGALSAVTASTLVGRKPVTPNRLSVPPSLATSALPMTSAPALPPRPRPQPVPNAGVVRETPPGASTYARMPRPEPPQLRAVPPLAPVQPTTVGIPRPPVATPQATRPAPAVVTPIPTPAANAPGPTPPVSAPGIRAGGTLGAPALPQAGSLPLK